MSLLKNYETIPEWVGKEENIGDMISRKNSFILILDLKDVMKY